MGLWSGIITSFLSFLGLWHVTAGSGCDHVTADLVFLIDSSGSVGALNFQSQLGFMSNFSEAFAVGRTAMQIGVVTFSSTPKLEFNLNAYNDKASLVVAVRNIPYISGGTHTAEALDFVRLNSFTANAGDRRDASNIVIVLTDGKSTDATATANSGKQLRNTGVEVYAVGIGQGIGTSELQTVASGNDHVVQVNSFSQLSSIQDTIRNSLCQKINECDSNPCQHGGSCTDGLGTYSCRCVPGYTGNNCETNIDECASQPCQHGGHCQDGVAAYTCRCSHGYTGDNCDTDIDECASTPCQHGGQCQDGVAAYMCRCSHGYTGDNCEIDIDECASKPCQHGGQCQDGVAAYTCQCSPGYTGDNCETALPACDSNPCQNGGACTNSPSGFNCSCRKNFFGQNCEIDFCADMVQNCDLLFGVCKDVIRASTICRHTCGICGDSQILFVGETSSTRAPAVGGTSAAPCRDTVNCQLIFGVCTNQTLSETVCRETCGACGDVHIVFG